MTGATEKIHSPLPQDGWVTQAGRDGAGCEGAGDRRGGGAKIHKSAS